MRLIAEETRACCPQSEWEEAHDEASGQTYHVNHNTSTTQWTEPGDAEADAWVQRRIGKLLPLEPRADQAAAAQRTPAHGGVPEAQQPFEVETGQFSNPLMARASSAGRGPAAAAQSPGAGFRVELAPAISTADQLFDAASAGPQPRQEIAAPQPLSSSAPQPRQEIAAPQPRRLPYAAIVVHNPVFCPSAGPDPVAGGGPPRNGGPDLRCLRSLVDAGGPARRRGCEGPGRRRGVLQRRPGARVAPPGQPRLTAAIPMDNP